MNKKWYEIDVKKEVWKELISYFNENQLPLEITNELKKQSVRNLMDEGFISAYSKENYPDISMDIKEFCSLSKDLYFKYRGLKYGQEYFWKSAQTERDLGYNHKWHDYVLQLLKPYTKPNDNILFVGTANGTEIPYDDSYMYYALEQLQSSVESMSKSLHLTPIVGDFEDNEMSIQTKNNAKFKGIFALRCLMPNTRLDNFFQFVHNNLQKDGVLIVSHPMSYLDENNQLQQLPNNEKTLEYFEKNLKDTANKSSFNILDSTLTNIEQIYILKGDV